MSAAPTLTIRPLTEAIGGTPAIRLEPGTLTIEHVSDMELSASGPAVAATPGRFSLLTVAEITEIPDLEPLLEGLLYRRTLAAIIGKYASYKSFFLLDLALHIAHGLDWHGRRVTAGVVVYIYAEGVHGIRRRVESWRLLNQLPDVGGIYFLPRSVLLNDPRDLRDFLAAIEARGVTPVAVFVDTVARTFKGNESAQEDMNAYIAACDHIKDATGATVVLAHHTGWEGTRSRGSSNLPGALDTEITLTRDDTRVTVKVTKQKDGTEGEIAALEAVPIGQSLALKSLGHSSAELSKNERQCLAVVQDSPGLSMKAWEEISGIPRSSLYIIRNRLMSLAYVRCAQKKWSITEAGAQALRPMSNGSLNAV